MPIVVANRTAQSGTYYTGSPNYVDVSSGTAEAGMVTFSAKATDASWDDGVEIGVVVVKDDDNWQVWRATWDETNEYLEVVEVEDSAGTLSNADAVTVTATLTEKLMDRLVRVYDVGNYENHIINGHFDVWQLGTSFVSPAHTSILADRWLFGQSSGTATWTVTREEDVPSVSRSNYSLKCACTGSDASLDALDETHLRYGMEGYDFRRFVGKTCTLSFYVKASTTGTYCVAFSNIGGDRSYVAEYTVNATGTWEYKEIVVPFDYVGGTWNLIEGIGVKIRFSLRNGSTYQTTAGAWQSGNYVGTSSQVDLATNGRYIQLSDVVFNEGPYAQRIIKPDYANTLIKCMRYLEVFGCTTGGINAFTGYGTSTGAVNFDIPVQLKRVAPTTIYVGSAETDYALTDIATSVISGVTFTDYARSPHIWKMQATKTSAFTVGAPYIMRLITTSGKIGVTAELYP